MAVTTEAAAAIAVTATRLGLLLTDQNPRQENAQSHISALSVQRQGTRIDGAAAWDARDTIRYSRSDPEQFNRTAGDKLAGGRRQSTGDPGALNRRLRLSDSAA